MADLDTREKRSSGIHIGLPWRGMVPLPDGDISQADRQHLAFLYSGILAGAPVIPSRNVSIIDFSLRAFSVDLSLRADRVKLTLVE